MSQTLCVSFWHSAWPYLDSATIYCLDKISMHLHFERDRAHTRVLALDAHFVLLGTTPPPVGGQVGRVATASEPQCDVLPDRRKARPYYENAHTNTDSLFLCLHCLLASNQNCNHISQLARSLAENDCWRLHKLPRGRRRRLVVRLQLHRYCKS